MFYQQIAGGCWPRCWRSAPPRWTSSVDTSLVITASIVLLLSGIGFMGAIQDALSGFYLTAGARIIEALLATAGLIAGVSAGLALAPVLGVSLATSARASPALADAPLVLVGAIVSACAFAFTCYAPLRALPAVAMTHAARPPRLPRGAGPQRSRCRGRPRARPWSIGVVSYTIAGRVGVPPLVVVVPALVPMLPGPADLPRAELHVRGHTHSASCSSPPPRPRRSRWPPA